MNQKAEKQEYSIPNKLILTEGQSGKNFIQAVYYTELKP